MKSSSVQSPSIFNLLSKKDLRQCRTPRWISRTPTWASWTPTWASRSAATKNLRRTSLLWRTRTWTNINRNRNRNRLSRSPKWSIRIHRQRILGRTSSTLFSGKNWFRFFSKPQKDWTEDRLRPWKASTSKSYYFFFAWNLSN